MSSLVGEFIKPGATGAQAITGLGFRPVALYMFSAYNVALNAYETNWLQSHAFFDGTSAFGSSSTQNAFGGPAVGLGSAGFTYQGAGFPLIGVSGGATPSLLAFAVLQSFDAGGFTLNWTTNDGVTTGRMFYLAIGGVDVTNAKVMSFTPHGRLGQQRATGMGFRPNVVLFIPSFSASVPTTHNTISGHGLGCGISVADQWAVAGFSKGDATRPSYATRHQRDDRCIIIPQPVGVSIPGSASSRLYGTDRTVEGEASFISRDLDGFTVDWKTAGTYPVWCLGLKGGRYKAGSMLKLQGSQPQAIYGIGFQATGMIWAGDGRHESLVGQPIPLTERKLSLGAADGTLTMAAIAVHDQDLIGYGAGSSWPVNARNSTRSYFCRQIDANVVVASSVVLADCSLDSFNAEGSISIRWANADSLRRQFMYLLMGSYATGAACGTNGAAPTTTDPSADATLTTATLPLVFVELALDSGTKRYARIPISDPSTYYGGPKQARVLEIGPIRRALSDLSGTYHTASVTIRLSDEDRAIRALEAAGTLMNRRVDVYCVDDVDRRAATAARRMGSFVIRRFKAEADLSFTLELEDWFGSQLNEYDQGKLIPQNLFTKTIFADLPDALVNVPEPVGYGSLSDEANGIDAVGVVPLYYTGQETVNSFKWDRYVVFGHAIKSIQSWFASDLAPNPRRIKMPSTTEGVDFLIPGYAGWLAHTGSAVTYKAFGGRRYTVIYARGPRSDAHKDGTVPLALNVCGIEDVGDSSGTMINHLPRQILHAMTNQVSQNYLTGAWLSVPSSNGYSQMKSVAGIITAAGGRTAFGYLGAFILGGNNGQITVAEFIKRAAISCDVQIGLNRHGQVMLSMEDSTIASVATFTDVKDIDKDGFDVTVGFDDLANTLPYRWGPVYLPPASKDLPDLKWTEDTSLSDGSAITAHLQTKVAPAAELWFTNDETTADSVATYALARRTGGAAPYRGPLTATIKGGLNLSAAELGDNVTVTHFASVGASGWVAQKVRVMGIIFEPNTLGITLEVMKV